MPGSSRSRRAVAPRALATAVTAFASLAAAVGAFHVDEMRTVETSAGAEKASAAARAAGPSRPVVEPSLRSHAEAAARRRWIAHFAFPKYAAALERLAMWDRLAQCETAGNWRDGGDYGGGLGIYIGTWRAYGGREFAPRPQDATKEQQIQVAERIAADGMGGWGCAHRLGLVG